MSGVPVDAKRRVKLYALNANRQWDDKGTGHVISCFHEPLDGMSLLVRNESDGSLLLESKIQLDTQYQKQQGTLIVWTESDNYDLALSFQDKDGCNEIWEKICQVQGRDPSSEQDNDDEEVRIDQIEIDYDNIHLISEQVAAYSLTARRRDVLAADYVENDCIDKLIRIFRQAEEKRDIATLHKLYDIFKQLFLYDRTAMTEALLKESILMDVIGIFEYEPPNTGESRIEDVSDSTNQNQDPNHEQEMKQQQTGEQEDHLDEQPQQYHQDDNQKDEKVEETESKQTENDCKTNEDIDSCANEECKKVQHPLGELSQEHLDMINNRKKHREFLENGTTFKEVIPFGDQDLVDKIHHTYLVQYLQSSVLPAPSILEENAYNSLTNILFFYKVEIVSIIQENFDFLQELFNQIISSETGQDRKRELVLFLREYCMFSQAIQPKQRETFFKTLASLRILSAVEVALSSNDQIIKSAAIDIFTYLVEYSPHMTREHAVQQQDSSTDTPNCNTPQTPNILKLVIEHITTDQDPELGTATQLSCIIRLLLDPENMPGDAMGKHSFLEFFYHTCMQSLVEPIKNSTTADGDIEPSANDRKTAQLLSIMLELLTFFMEHHYSLLRNYIVSSDLLTRIISLIKSRHKFLILSVVRFFRRLVATKDNLYFELIMHEKLFSPIIQVLKNNNGRYNLLDSAILEMFEFIQTEELLPLINHLLTEFGPILDSIDYVNTFEVMRQKKEKLHNAMDERTLKPNRSNMDNSRMYFANRSRSDVESLWFESIGADVHDVGDVDSDKSIDDPEPGDAVVDSDSDGMTMPDMEFSVNGGKNDEDDEVEDEEDVDDEEEEEEDDVEDDIHMDDEDCDNELEPQFKKKKTK